MSQRSTFFFESFRYFFVEWIRNECVIKWSLSQQLKWNGGNRSDLLERNFGKNKKSPCLKESFWKQSFALMFLLANSITKHVITYNFLIKPAKLVSLYIACCSWVSIASLSFFGCGHTIYSYAYGLKWKKFEYFCYRGS